MTQADLMAADPIDMGMYVMHGRERRIRVNTAEALHARRYELTEKQLNHPMVQAALKFDTASFIFGG